MSESPSMAMDFVSIIIPAWNNSHYLAESIRSALDDADEIIVVDDASEDGTPQSALESFLAEERVRLLRLPENRGPGAARLAGLEVAKGDCVGFLDADDRYAPGALTKLRTMLRGNPSAEIALGRKIALCRQENDEFATEGDIVRMYSLGSSLSRRSLLERVSIDPSIRHGEDIDWFMRIQEAGARFELLDEVVQEYRRHETNLTVVEEGEAKQSELADVMARSMIRRRRIAKQREISVSEVYYVRPDNFGSHI